MEAVLDAIHTKEKNDLKKIEAQRAANEKAEAAAAGTTVDGT